MKARTSNSLRLRPALPLLLLTLLLPGDGAARNRLAFPPAASASAASASGPPSNDERWSPPVVIERVSIGGKVFPRPDEVRLLPGQETFEVQYTNVNAADEGPARFRYRLEGAGREWVDAGTRRVAGYSHLPPGTYTFTVTAAGRDGVWGERGASVRIVVVPPFWRQWWVIGAAVVYLFGIGFLLYDRNVRQVKQARRTLAAFSRQLIDSQERERQRIAAELHDSLGQNLLIIKNRALLGRGAGEAGGKSREQFDEIIASASQALEEVREIAYNLRPVYLERLGLTSALEAMIEQVAGASPIRFSAQLAALDGLFTKEDEISLYRIVQEGINNIIKHSHATDAQIEIGREGRTLRLVVADNGYGCRPESAATAPDGARGFGLTGMSERVAMLGGTQIIESTPGRGTKIVIHIPLRGDAARKSEAGRRTESGLRNEVGRKRYAE